MYPVQKHHTSVCQEAMPVYVTCQCCLLHQPGTLKLWLYHCILTFTHPIMESQQCKHMPVTGSKLIWTLGSRAGSFMETGGIHSLADKLIYSLRNLVCCVFMEGMPKMANMQIRWESNKTVCISVVLLSLIGCLSYAGDFIASLQNCPAAHRFYS